MYLISLPFSCGRTLCLVTFAWVDAAVLEIGIADAFIERENEGCH